MASRTTSRLGSILLVLALLSSGCPPDHPPGPRSDACVDVSDCNAERCGDLVPCVRGFCLTDAPPNVVPCQDAGNDGPRYECDGWQDCNPDRSCGDDLVTCVDGRCDPRAAPTVIPCGEGEGGVSDGDAG